MVAANAAVVVAVNVPANTRANILASISKDRLLDNKDPIEC